MTIDDLRERRINAFLQLAQEERSAGARLSATNPRQAAFCLQQAVEKLVRATLEHANVPAGPTHNIRTLTDLLPPNHSLRETFLVFDDWSSAATRFRYPSSTGKVAEISVDEVKHRLAAIGALESDVLKYLGKGQS